MPTRIERLCKNVADGAKLLDKVFPDWHLKVDPNKLKIRRCRDCVLGQLYGNFGEGLTRLMNIDDDELVQAIGYGFAYDARSDYLEAGEYSLEEIWIQEIRQRREKVNVV